MIGKPAVELRSAFFNSSWGAFPRRAGKDDHGVGYVKRNAIAGHAFESWEVPEAHLVWWMREIADVRVHGTTREPPLLRFERDEAAAPRPVTGRPPFRQIRELVRKVQADCAFEADANAYSVPWRLIGESVQVSVSAGRVRIHHAGCLVAEHAEAPGRRGRIVEPSQLAGILGFPGAIPAAPPDEPPLPPPDA